MAGESPVRSESLVKGESLAAGISRRKKRNLADDLKEILAEGKAEEEKEKLESAKSRTKTLFREESEEAKKSAAFIADWKKSIMGMLPSGRGKRSAAKAVAAGAAAAGKGAAAGENQIRLTDAQVDAEWRRRPARR